LKSWEGVGWTAWSYWDQAAKFILFEIIRKVVGYFGIEKMVLDLGEL
jgi:hypothetical protein